MDINFFIDNLSNPAVLIPAVKQDWKGFWEYEAFKNYDPVNHKVNNHALRKNKMVTGPVPGAVEDPQTGEIPTQTVSEPVNRLSIPLQKLIVSRQSAFLTAGKVALQCKPKNETETKLYNLVVETWDTNKLQFKNNAISKRLKSETECVEIWYSKKNQDNTVSMKCNIYSPSLGYQLIPTFDHTQDLIGFTLIYDSVAEKKRYADTYTVDKLMRYVDSGRGWEIKDEVDLLYGKMPVIYYSQDRSAWADVQPAIERLEELLSNFADTNDYNGSPILFAKGKILGFAKKGERGKLIESDGEGADLKYVSWEQAPESIKLEIETLFDIIYTCTQTPNISFKEMKGLGDISGVAFDRIMIDAHLKAKDQQDGEFGECIQRRLNFLIAACIETNPGLEAAKDLRITPIFSLFKIDSAEDNITVAQKANGGLPVMTLRESIEYAGVSQDTEATTSAIEEQMKTTAPVNNQPQNQ